MVVEKLGTLNMRILMVVVKMMKRGVWHMGVERGKNLGVPLRGKTSRPHLGHLGAQVHQVRRVPRQVQVLCLPENISSIMNNLLKNDKKLLLGSSLQVKKLYVHNKLSQTC